MGQEKGQEVHLCNYNPAMLWIMSLCSVQSDDCCSALDHIKMWSDTIILD